MAAVRPLQPKDPAWLGPYELLGWLGEGGQSVVYLGRDKEGRKSAVKLLRAQLSQSPEWRARFRRELAVIGRVTGFCTAQVLDADVEGDLPYVVSEYVPGPSLTELVAVSGPRTGTDLDRLAIGTITALAAIHRAGILHRDFKPSNVLMGPDGPRVIDFGIARVLGSATAKASVMVGTPSFMAPEQVVDGELGVGVDVFAWGATILFAATGRRPFGNDTIAAVFHRILNYEPDLSPLPEPLRGIVASCLSKDPALRPEAQQVLLDLLGQQVPMVPESEAALSTGASFAGEQPGPADGQGQGPRHASRPVTSQTQSTAQTIPPAVPWRRRWWWRIVAIAVTLVLLAGGSAAWGLVSHRSPAKPATPVADTVAPSAEATAAMRAAADSIKSVLSFSYAAVDQDIASAHARVTQRYREEYDRQLVTRNWRVRLRDTKGSVGTEVVDSAVVAASPATVTVLAYVKRTVRSANAQPNLLSEPMRVTMVRQGGGWLLDTLFILTADSVPGATGDSVWPGAQARAVLDAAGGDKTVSWGTLVESALRSGGEAGQMTALMIVGACSKGACKPTDQVSVQRLLLRQQSGGWQVAKTEWL